MLVTVLGKSPSWEDAGGACSGYLVRENGHAMLLDCGNGVFGKLRAQVDYGEVDTVLLTHLHADHFLDLVPFSYALLYAPRDPRPRPPVLHAPPGAAHVFQRVTGAWGSDDLIEKAFDMREYGPGAELAAGSLRIRVREMSHYVQCFAIELTSGDGGGRFVFSADTGPTDALVEFASGADTLMVEATLAEAGDENDRGHLTAREAGEHAARAGVRRLVLTHITDELDPVHAREEAGAVYDGEIVVASEGLDLEV